MYRDAAMRGTGYDPNAPIDPWAPHPTDDGKYPLPVVVGWTLYEEQTETRRHGHIGQHSPPTIPPVAITSL
jgi:hypothetical protein